MSDLRYFHNGRQSEAGEPAWEVAHFFPHQGDWSEGDFLKLHTNRMAELVAGRLEILPMPTWLHQLIVDFLCTHLKDHLKSGQLGGTVLFAPLPLRLFADTIREPDILYFSPANIPDDLTGYPETVDLVMEVVSSGAAASKRDYEQKRDDYAKAGIKEYWIVDPEREKISVLSLDGLQYQEAGVYQDGQIAISSLLPGFKVEMNQLLALCNKTR